ncbi:hypothetical protein [Phocaeicola plebeius]|jgi:hypothetical protein|uniref:hypothetical protein n=1 Tax=Phocaeicola plebeius TaxID=310297 RepID=UPI0026E9A1EB|nr:hypothetical protein [Phocaeicola plebeius]
MKKIDSSNILFFICTGFVLLVMLGLILQSCRTARLDESIQNVTDIKTENKAFALDDHVSLSGLSQTWRDNYRIVIRDYQVVNDSSGHPSPVLSKETELVHDKSYNRDSTSQTRAQNLSVDSTSTESSSEHKNTKSVDKQPYVSPLFCWLFIPLVLLIIFFYKSKFK